MTFCDEFMRFETWAQSLAREPPLISSGLPQFCWSRPSNSTDRVARESQIFVVAFYRLTPRL